MFPRIYTDNTNIYFVNLQNKEKFQKKYKDGYFLCSDNASVEHRFTIFLVTNRLLKQKDFRRLRATPKINFQNILSSFAAAKTYIFDDIITGIISSSCHIQLHQSSKHKDS